MESLCKTCKAHSEKCPDIKVTNCPAYHHVDECPACGHVHQDPGSCIEEKEEDIQYD